MDFYCDALMCFHSGVDSAAASSSLSAAQTSFTSPISLACRASNRSAVHA
jgi:hypothetical protein